METQRKYTFKFKVLTSVNKWLQWSGINLKTKMDQGLNNFNKYVNSLNQC